MFIIDECHISHAYVANLMSTYNNCIFIGLTATPYSRGLANIWQDMVVPTTTKELLNAGYLTPIEYYVGHKVDMTGVRKSGGEYNQGDLAKSVDKDEVLTGDIIKNWMDHAKGRPMQTIAFTPSIDHSKGLVELFREKGVKAEHIDCYTSEDDRDMLYEAHDRGEFCILSCSQLLNTGYDAPGVECLIDCYPVNSLITHVQRGGRIQRIAEGKTHAIYLDHAGNVERHGFIEDIVPDHLNDKNTKESQDALKKEDGKTEPEQKKCPRCYQSYTGFICACGYEVPAGSRLAHDGTKLVWAGAEVNRSKMSPSELRNIDQSQVQKDEFKAGLVLHALQKDYKAGWVANQYRAYYSEWPDRTHVLKAEFVPNSVKKWLTSQNIRRAKRKVA